MATALHMTVVKSIEANKAEEKKMAKKTLKKSKKMEATKPLTLVR